LTSRSRGGQTTLIAHGVVLPPQGQRKKKVDDLALLNFIIF